MKRRPRLMVDIKSGPNHPYVSSERRVDLRREKLVSLPLFWMVRVAAVMLSVAAFVFGTAAAPTGGQTTLAAAPEEERQELEAQLRELEKQIVEYESTIDKYRQQGSSLKSEIQSLEAKISKINLQIRSTKISLERLDNEITHTVNRIGETERSIEDNKDNLAEILQDIYEKDSTGLLEIMLKNPKLSDFVDDFNNVILVQDGLRVTLHKIIDLRDDLLNQKEVLALERQDKEALIEYQAAQAAQVDKVVDEKDELLKVTKGQEAKYQEILNETKKTAAEIRSRIFRLLGGGELTFEKAYELAKFAEGVTGIRAALILSVLDQESALGRNVGSCTYQTAMHPTRDIPAFLSITSELGLDPESVKVSCAIVAHGAYGGAMGPAQFIPSTWVLYKDDIAKVTGNNPPSPWRNQDAFVATALYLKDSYFSNSCREYSQIIPSEARTLQERCAAAQYYSGGRWYTYRWIYGEPVVERANRFQADIDILEGR